MLLGSSKYMYIYIYSVCERLKKLCFNEILETSLRIKFFTQTNKWKKQIQIDNENGNISDDSTTSSSINNNDNKNNNNNDINSNNHNDISDDTSSNSDSDNNFSEIKHIEINNDNKAPVNSVHAGSLNDNSDDNDVITDMYTPDMKHDIDLNNDNHSKDPIKPKKVRKRTKLFKKQKKKVQPKKQKMDIQQENPPPINNVNVNNMEALQSKPTHISPHKSPIKMDSNAPKISDINNIHGNGLPSGIKNGKSDELDKKFAKMLSDPDYKFNGTWDNAKREGTNKNKWILVSIQASSKMESHCLDRDVFNDNETSAIIKSNFIFYQCSDKHDRYHDEAIKVMNLYNKFELPTLFVVDPNTGAECVDFNHNIRDIPDKGPIIRSKIKDFLHRFSDPKKHSFFRSNVVINGNNLNNNGQNNWNSFNIGNKNNNQHKSDDISDDSSSESESLSLTDTQTKRAPENEPTIPCKVCTFLNKMDAKQCEICSSNMDGSKPINNNGPPQYNDYDEQDWNNHNNSNNNNIKHNNYNNSNYNNNYNHEFKSDQPGSINDSNSLKDSDINLNNYWSCTYCQRKNKKGSLACKGCYTKKPPTNKQWECHRCGYYNSITATKCMCGTLRKLNDNEWVCTKCGKINDTLHKSCIQCKKKNGYQKHKKIQRKKKKKKFKKFDENSYIFHNKSKGKQWRKKNSSDNNANNNSNANNNHNNNGAFSRANGRYGRIVENPASPSHSNDFSIHDSDSHFGRDKIFPWICNECGFNNFHWIHECKSCKALRIHGNIYENNNNNNSNNNNGYNGHNGRYNHGRNVKPRINNRNAKQGQHNPYSYKGKALKAKILDTKSFDKIPPCPDPDYVWHPGKNGKPGWWGPSDVIQASNNHNNNYNDKSSKIYDWKKGDYGFKSNKLCQIISVNSELYPPSITVKMIDSGREIETDFEKIAKIVEYNSYLLLKQHDIAIHPEYGTIKINEIKIEPTRKHKYAIFNHIQERGSILKSVWLDELKPKDSIPHTIQKYVLNIRLNISLNNNNQNQNYNYNFNNNNNDNINNNYNQNNNNGIKYNESNPNKNDYNYNNNGNNYSPNKANNNGFDSHNKNRFTHQYTNNYSSSSDIGVDPN